jgi:CheY-like chemotaxis protein
LSNVSQAETNHHVAETSSPVLSGRLVGDSSRVFSNSGPGIHAAAGDHHATCEAAAVCSRFLVKLSHQMRTRLNSIMGMTEMMLRTGLSDPQKEFIETVADSAQALASMTDAISDFSRCLVLGAEQYAHQSAMDENALEELDAVADRGPLDTADAARESNRGAQDMLSKAPVGGNRVFNSAASFRTRVPPAMAKLIRILVAEDHLMNQHVMLRMLARLGYSADAVCNGAEAVAALARSPYDIVLMDCQMPELDGYEATRQIRNSGGRFKSTPIIAVTANAMDGDREKCLASGMSDYMSKPVLAKTLATTLEKWILPATAAGVSVSADATLAAASLPASPSLDQVAQAGKVPAESAPVDAEATKAAPAPIADAVDAGALASLRAMDAGDDGFMTKIIELFLADSTERIEALKAAAQTRDGPALKSIAHALKGSCGHFGATRLAALCRKMEQIGLQDPVGDPVEVLRDLEAEADRVRVALEEEAKRISSTKSMMEESD